MENDGGSGCAKKSSWSLAVGGVQVAVSGDFDSGNLNSACVDLQRQEVQLTFGKDKDVKPSSKTWFYFSLTASQPTQLKLQLQATNTLTTAAKIYELFRPVVRYEGSDWQRHSQPVDFELSPEGDVSFRMVVPLEESKKCEIALCYPWSFSENQNFLNELEKRMAGRKDVYFNKEVLIRSPEGRPIHLLAISDNHASNYPSDRYLEHLFPERERETHFLEIHKPLVLVTARVHPGEVGSSYAMLGMLELLCGDTPQGAKLREDYYFLIVPMLNPDGVFLGNNRMDALGQNLNRFYHLPDLTLQPSCYAIKTLVQNFRRELLCFFDLHGHANKKSCFLFGNSINNMRKQAESVLFAKHLSSNCEHIEFKACNFSKRQMSSKDKNEEMSKEGCARVVVHRWTDSPYCYTLQTGLFRDVRVDEKGILRLGEKFYSPAIYRKVGAQMLLSFHAILGKSPELDDMRKFCLDYVMRLEKASRKDKPKPQKVPKSLKSLKQQETDTQQSRPIQSQKQNQVERVCKSGEQRIRQVNLALQRNKGQLLRLQQQDDE